MKKRFNRALALALCLMLTFSVTAASAGAEDYTPYAESLSELGVFKGTGSGFALDRTATRIEGVVMLVRLMGGEAEAQAMAGEAIPFTDVQSWASGYVAYAWKNGLTNGTGGTTFGSDNLLDARMYVTFLLRCLGYRDSEGDFSYAQALDFAASIGLLDDALKTSAQGVAFLRGHVARLSYEALRFPCKGSDALLIEKLSGEGKIDAAVANRFLSGAVQSSGTSGELTTADIAENTASMVLVLCQVPEGSVQGSGIIIGADGTIVTNYHVIDGASSIKLEFDDGTWYEGAVYIQDYSAAEDLAVLKIDKTGLTPAKLGDSDQVRVGEKVVAIGSPYGYFNTVSEGIVSSVRGGEIQTTAAISHGSSGGALFNGKGEVIGVTSAGVDVAQNLGFAIPINEVKALDQKRMLSLSAFSREAPPPAPENLRLTQEDGESVYLQWNPVEGADCYYFYYSKATDSSYTRMEKDGKPVRFTWQEGWSAQYYGLEEGQVYEVAVSAVKGEQESALSASLVFTKRAAGGQGGNYDSIPYYTDAWWVPDFGAMYGVSASYHADEQGVILYSYQSYAGGDVSDYQNVLKQVGYVYDPTAAARLTSFNKPMCYYNPTTSRMIVTDTERDGSFSIYTVR